VKIAYNCLIVDYRDEVTDQKVSSFQKLVLDQALLGNVKGVILDVSAVTLMDSFASRSLLDTCRMTNLLGKRAIVVGMKPAVVFSLVDMDVELNGVETAVNVESAMTLIDPPADKIIKDIGEELDENEDSEESEGDEKDAVADAAQEGRED